MIKSTIERQRYMTSNKRLRRARRRYMYLCKDAIFIWRNPLIDEIAKKMQERGLYSSKSHPRNIRQSMMSHMYRIEGGTSCGLAWHEWCLKNAYDPYSGYFKKIHKEFLTA